ncbi:hypothetical protein D3C71_1476470 [compost metagenome]
MLHGAFNQAVLDLQRDQRRPAAQVRQGLQFGDAPRRGVADAQILDLAGADEIVQRAHHFVRAGGEVPGVYVQQIDAIGIQLAQAGFHRAHQVVAVVAAGIDVGRVARHGELGGQHQPVTPALGEAAEDAFGGAVGVVDRGIDEVAAAVDVGIENPLGFSVIGAPAPVGAEGHRAQREGGDAQPGAAEQAVVIKRGRGRHAKDLRGGQGGACVGSHCSGASR